MIVVSIIMKDDPLLNEVYDFDQRFFNSKILKKISEKMKANYFNGSDSKVLVDFLFFCLLNEDERQRTTPKKSLLILKRIVKTFKSELKDYQLEEEEVNVKLSIENGLNLRTSIDYYKLA